MSIVQFSVQSIIYPQFEDTSNVLTIVDFFIPVSSFKFSTIPFILRGGRFILGNQYKLYRMTHYHVMTIQFQGHPALMCCSKPLKILCLSSSILVHYKKFQGSRLLKYLNQYKTHRLPATKYKPKLLHGLPLLFHAR